MRFKKIVLGAVSVLALGARAGCSDNRVHYDWDLKDPGTLKEGFVDLANKKANSPLRADGKYVAGKAKIYITQANDYVEINVPASGTSDYYPAAVYDKTKSSVVSVN